MLSAPKPREPEQTVVDWEATAVLLLERASEPAFLIDRDGAVAIVNRKLAALIDVSRDALIGARVDDVFPLRDGQGAWPLAFALRGSIREFECTTARGDGRAIRLAGELNAVGTGDDGCLIALVTRHCTDACGPCGARYEVSTGPAPGRLLRVLGDDGTMTEPARRDACYRALQGRDAPCAGCPVFAEPPCGAGVVADERGLRLVATRAVAAGVVEVSALDVDDSLMSQLTRARIDAIATAAGLTDRERAVLQYILLARSADEIGQLMGISGRTVKFHQANLLAKIGAESRLDLLRLLL